MRDEPRRPAAAARRPRPASRANRVAMWRMLNPFGRVSDRRRARPPAATGASVHHVAPVSGLRDVETTADRPRPFAPREKHGRRIVDDSPLERSHAGFVGLVAGGMADGVRGSIDASAGELPEVHAERPSASKVRAHDVRSLTSLTAWPRTGQRRGLAIPICRRSTTRRPRHRLELPLGQRAQGARSGLANRAEPDAGQVLPDRRPLGRTSETVLV